MESPSYTPRRLLCFVQSRTRTERGAALLEYAMLVGLIAVVALISVAAFGGALGDKTTGIAGTLTEIAGLD